MSIASTSGRISAQTSRTFVFDPERIFILGDADLDGRLSLDEYQDFLRAFPRMNRPTVAAESMFRGIDANHDNYISLSEYRKSFPPGPGASVKPNDPREKPAAVDSAVAITPDQEKFFEEKIRPVLTTQCGKCHSSAAQKLRGGLRLDSREGLRLGGESGRAITPGDPEQSLLIRAIRYQDDDLKMPPKKKLADSIVADFETWIRMGAPDPRIEGSHTKSNLSSNSAKSHEFWSFQPPKKHDPPEVKRTDWPRDDIDRFLLAKIEARGLAPVADANRERLIRRATFDLVGLPPTPEEIDAFVQDNSPAAFNKVVDRLLASPHFGERWGRYWLDAARFAESSGKTNFMYSHAWRYRDWVIASFNADKPYDRFVREQIAGDLLPAENNRQRAERLIATGFLALGSKAHDAENRGQFILDVIDEQIETTTRAFLGLTVACARCHDHKLDPISQRDYYALSGVFRSTRTCSGTLAGVFPNFNASPLIELPSGANMPSAVPSLSAEQRSSLEKRIAELTKERGAIPPGEANRDRLRRVNSMLAMLRYRLLIDRPGGTPRTFAMGVLERDECVNSPIYIRGELDQPGELVPRGLIRLLRDESNESIMSGSGRRELADRLASSTNPLTARVMVNRVWLHLFGRGLVATPDNFGAAGSPPSHPELLDTLSVDFMNDGWSIKRLIRRIVLSKAYGLDSTFNPRYFEIDPDNILIWRMSKRRLDAEAIRDAALKIGGRLTAEPPVGSSAARTGEGLAMFLRIAGQDVSDTHRSVYLPIIRDQILESLALFDFADPSLVTGERSTTTGPAQALYFLNSPFVIQQAESLAGRVIAFSDDDSRRVDCAYRLTLARSPSPAEQDRAFRFLRDFTAGIVSDDSKREAWNAFCQALFACAEFRYLD